MVFQERWAALASGAGLSQPDQLRQFDVLFKQDDTQFADFAQVVERRLAPCRSPKYTAHAARNQHCSL